jgi:hydroxymethylbilane synthase
MRLHIPRPYTAPAARRACGRPVAVVRRGARVVCSASTATKTVKIGTRGSPLALAQAYMTRDLLKVRQPERRAARGAAEGRAGASAAL